MRLELAFQPAVALQGVQAAVRVAPISGFRRRFLLEHPSDRAQVPGAPQQLLLIWPQGKSQEHPATKKAAELHQNGQAPPLLPQVQQWMAGTKSEAGKGHPSLILSLSGIPTLTSLPKGFVACALHTFGKGRDESKEGYVEKQ